MAVLPNLPNVSTYNLSSLSLTSSSPPAIYLLYAKLEEEHGLARHAMSVYNRATTAVPADEQFEVLLEHHCVVLLTDPFPSSLPPTLPPSLLPSLL